MALLCSAARRTVLVAMLAVLCSVLLASPAAAHAELVSSNPASPSQGCRRPRGHPGDEVRSRGSSGREIGGRALQLGAVAVRARAGRRPVAGRRWLGHRNRKRRTQVVARIHPGRWLDDRPGLAGELCRVSRGRELLRRDLGPEVRCRFGSEVLCTVSGVIRPGVFRPCVFRTGGIVLGHALLPESIAAVAGALRADPSGATIRPDTVRPVSRGAVGSDRLQVRSRCPHCPHGCPQL